MQIVGVSLIRNEDRFVERALRNVADFCDVLLVADHVSTDRTCEIVSRLATELDHLDVHRIRHAADSHTLVEGFAGTHTWVLSVDGDELYDPARLATFRDQLEAGAFDDVFRVRPAALHCDELDVDARRAAGHLSPPGRPLVGILNFAAIDRWSNVSSERLHGGDIRFRPGFDMDSWRHLGAEDGWERSAFRALHVCFLARSTADDPAGSARGRPNLAETLMYDRGTGGAFKRAGRRILRRRNASDHPHWKAEKYRRGERVVVDPAPFFP